ncbi:MAG: tRNA (guanosine(37)-N1)-methyltransferase TrmD [Clostridiaceae bacterium]|jgi:tRNA (guanine37-N1)-methyltransferase|nr:tRNA (guanosine(37)-N1)-methyltransferase TrmD [Clostridiaceae bacterium]
MKIDILTLFPEMIEGVLGQSIIGRAREFGLIEITAHNIRDYSPDKRRRTDDYPYGGGMGMVMQCEPLYQAWLAARQGQPVHTILMSPQGTPFCQQKAKELLTRDRFILVCGHYEGVDQRFIDECVDEEISLGDFVLTGGEIAAAAIADAVCRMVPGVLAEDASFTEESHFAGLLEYPQYTRPEQWRGRQVPEILLSGHHKNIQDWRRLQSLLRTQRRRPDLFAQLDLTKEDQKLVGAARQLNNEVE